MLPTLKSLAATLLVMLIAAARAAPPGGGACNVPGVNSGACESASKGAWQGEFFPTVGKIQYEGPDSTNPLSFHYYNESEVVMGKTMREWLRFSLAYWHTMRADGGDPFGSPTKRWPWEDASGVPQYDWDVATTSAFLLRYGLDKEFKLNIECNHATLAGHSCHHELESASIYGSLGSLDANTGDPQVGWDTDEFLTDPKQATLIMYTLLKQGCIAPGGLNFDAKMRRESTSLEDFFYAHISGMDTMARGLRNAAKLLEEGVLEGMRKERYSSFRDTALGRDIVKESVGFAELERVALQQQEPWDSLPSGSAELYEIWLSRYVR